VEPDPQHGVIRSALRKLRLNNEQRFYTSQNLAEFWSVCTRPAVARGGLGLSIADADRRARIIERLFTLLPDDASVHEEWRRMVVQYSVSGVAVHDARLVAFMRVYRVGNILTLNAADFARYDGIAPVHPQEV
jgi:predicted nucleic acid-binding protein